MHVPFAQETELNHQLKCVKTDASDSYDLVRTDDPQCKSLPGQPQMRLRSSTLSTQLENEFLTPDLNVLAPHLWLVATQSSSHITPLHELVLKGRDIVITENPELHLTWTNNRIFIKPIPPYMLSHAFWTTQLIPETPSHVTKTECDLPPEALTRAALGYMRTYYHLIQHESDFHIAKQSRLLPSDTKDMTIETFHQFIAGFGEIHDDQVSPRYSSYGTLRLSRLNMWAKVFLRRFQFYQVNRQYSEYFARFYAPMLFLFGILSVVLSAMQVGLQANNAGESGKDRWAPLQWASFWFSVATLLCICAIGLVISLLFVFMLLRELAFAAKDLVRRKRRDARASSAVTSMT